MAISTFHMYGRDEARVVPANTDTTEYHAGTYGEYEGYFAVTYKGAVLSTHERNGYDDSDFYAKVWTGEAVKSVEYATTRGWTYANSATVDATDEVKAAAAAWAATMNFKMLRDADDAKARTPDRGKRVRVISGRPTDTAKAPVAQGTEGTVIWEGPGKSFSRSRWGARPGRRVGVKTDDGRTFFTASTNVEVLDHEQYLTSDEDLQARATENALRQYDGRVAALVAAAPYLSH